MSSWGLAMKASNFVKKVGICITLNIQENSQNKTKFAGRNDTINSQKKSNS